MGERVDVGRVEAGDVEALAERLVEFVKPYQEVVGWTSREKQLGAFVSGLLGGTERKGADRAGAGGGSPPVAALRGGEPLGPQLASRSPAAGGR